MPSSELAALLMLNRTEGLGVTGARLLYRQFGSAQEVFLHSSDTKDIIPGADAGLLKVLQGSGYDVLVRNELDFMERHGIRCIPIDSPDYPSRMLECHDAPFLLFTLGNVDLNARRTVGIVGTRKATPYGKRMCREFVKDLHALCPDTVVISGLALGIDIEAHRTALEMGLCTYGVLGHGLDRIFPACHRDDAARMLDNGGLISEFQSGAVPFPSNFVRRNRIIAGLSDAVVVVEGAAKSGSLVTAEIAYSYNHECFAFPGCVGDPYSVGCNELIRDNRASLITNAMDFVTAMGWDCQERSVSAAVQKDLFPSLTDIERSIVSRISENAHGVHVNALIVGLNIPFSKLAGIMLSLELKGIAKIGPGSMCVLM